MNSVVVITALTCSFLAMTDGLLSLQPRCRCIETVEKQISDTRIVKLELFHPGPQCKDTEVIATVKFRKEITLCLNPKEKWVQDALKKWGLIP